ncbi:hypothetical protein Ccrd_023586 [Cynara cardunculus var. scolymus]|uniref:Uncharacterized protein n=1 Tax=Cynara cardunculus var. scolymus TaxID=59895 RepID=A0A103XWK4_CYNCS|nr:hypothetical protein Ccrd_023586 [Cynara cardunculus var. scolymus]
MELDEGTDQEDDDFEIEDEKSKRFETVESSGGSAGKPGLISFYNHPYEKEPEVVASTISTTDQTNLLWFVDFLILFFTEALFYCGVAVFLSIVDHLRRPNEPVNAKNRTIPSPQLVYRITSVAALVLSLVIPMVTMGLVWPWTGPAASATLAPYLVGIVVQFAFEQYSRYVKSPSWPVIPVIFQVYRLHQLNRAAQLVTALSFTVRGAESSPQNLAINSSLDMLLNVLQSLGVICIWSLSSFLMRFLPSATITEQ